MNISIPDFMLNLPDPHEQHELLWSGSLRVLVGCSLLLVALVALADNLLMLFMLLKFGRLRRVHNLFYMSLCTADLLAIALCLPVTVLKLLSGTATVDGKFLSLNIPNNYKIHC